MPTHPPSTNNYEILDESGYTSTIYRLPSPAKICKSFLPDFTEIHFPTEREAYTRFTNHSHPPSILKYYGVDTNDPAGLVLELAEKGNLYHYLWNCQRGSHPPPSHEILYRWASQAAEGLGFAHSCGVLNSDIHAINFLLDKDLNLKVGDWAGASIDGGTSCSYYRTTYLLPETTGTTISVASEIFAFGSALYYMVTGHEVLPELAWTQDREEDQEEIQRRFREKEFPDTRELSVLGPVIMKCWNLEYRCMAEVLKGIETEKREITLPI